MTPTGFTISLRGKKWVIVFENSKLQAVVDLNDFLFEKFTRESMSKLGIKESNGVLQGDSHALGNPQGHQEAKKE